VAGNRIKKVKIPNYAGCVEVTLSKILRNDRETGRKNLPDKTSPKKRAQSLTGESDLSWKNRKIKGQNLRAQTKKKLQWG